MDELDEMRDQIRALLDWKQEQEVAKAARIEMLHNAIVLVFGENKATIDEILAVLELVQHETTRSYISSRRTAQNLSDVAPADIE